MNCISVADFLSTYTYIYVIRMPSRVGSETLRNSSEHSALIYLKTEHKLGSLIWSCLSFTPQPKSCSMFRSVCLILTTESVTSYIYVPNYQNKQEEKYCFFIEIKTLFSTTEREMLCPFSQRGYLPLYPRVKCISNLIYQSRPCSDCLHISTILCKNSLAGKVSSIYRKLEN